MAGHTLDEMNQALGEFLTECGRVEFTMLTYVDFISDPGIEALFDEYSGKTLGTKIDWFKTWCEFSGVPSAKKPMLKTIYEDLDELLPKRNCLVHGETYEGAFKGNPRQPYRVGVIRKNLEYLDEFDRAEHGDNVFTVEQVQDATQLCIRIRTKLNGLRQP